MCPKVKSPMETLTYAWTMPRFVVLRVANACPCPGRDSGGASQRDRADEPMRQGDGRPPLVPAPTRLRFEYQPADAPAVGLGHRAPRLSWQLTSAPDRYVQGAYQIEVSGSDRPTRSATVSSRDQVLVPWPVEPLRSRERVAVRIRVRPTLAEANGWSDWSSAAIVEAGLLAERDWIARFVSPRTLGGLDMPAPVLRGVLRLPAGTVRSARLYVTALGCYVASLNGERVGDHVLAPGWTSYEHRICYQTFDVAHLLHAEDNVLDLLVGNGWYRGRMLPDERAVYGQRLAAIAQLEVTTDDGRSHVLATDETWMAGESEILADDLYDGQRTDLRRPRAADRTYPDRVDVLDADPARLAAPDGPPVRVTQLVPAVEVITSPSGATIVDFGQNLVGWVRLRVRDLPAGHEVNVRHAEVLEDGQLGTRPLRTAKATDSYVLDGADDIVLEPRLTFHGFRYAEVTGVPDLTADDIEAVVIGSDLVRSGWFSSSDKQLDRLHENVVWSARSNLIGAPLGCPQRDSRLGWTGDIQVFTPAATFLFDMGGFLASWLADLAAEQQADGSVPFVVPDVLRGSGPAAAAWGDAATIVPWVLYQRTGDTGVLERQLTSMRAWVDRVTGLAGSDRTWSGGFQFGDWLDPAAPPDAPDEGRADADVVASAHFVRSAEIVAAAASVLGDDEVADRYGALAREARAAFADAFVTPAGKVLSDAPTVYALAIEWALLPTERQRAHAGQRLADLVRAAGFRISTGFVGTPLIADALTSVGEVDIAYRLLFQQGRPSWLYPVTLGATTVWERWDSMLPDGRIHPSGMTSFNHYALGAVADWLHRTVAGLAPAEPGYRELLVQPRPGRQLTNATARHTTPYGEASVSWHRTGGRFRIAVHVPVGSRATIHLPGEPEPVRVGHGDHAWNVRDPIDQMAGIGKHTVIRDLVDDADLWDALVAISVESGLATDDVDVAHKLGRWLDEPIDRLAAALTFGGFIPGGETLMARFRPLLSRVERPEWNVDATLLEGEG
jgi:alpha-L-rhamnosidase